jgi:hypothetical protein
MGDLMTTVTVTSHSRSPKDVKIVVRTLEELFRTCQDAPPSDLVRVSIRGPEGEVHLNFASFIRTSPSTS